MPTFDTPITTNDTSFERVIAQSVPLLVYLYQRQPDSVMQAALERIASAEAGNLLVIRLDAADNPKAFERMGKPALPAIVTMQDGQAKSKAAPARPADVDAHVNYMLGRGPQPVETARPSAKSTAPGAPIPVSEAAFTTEVINSDVPVLVDFWAEWCGPCHMVSPILDRLAQQYGGQVKFVKVNVDENPGLSQRFNVTGIPQLLMFRGGQPVGKLVGAHPQGNIEQMIKQALA